jgi:hypothetical protein
VAAERIGVEAGIGHDAALQCHVQAAVEPEQAKRRMETADHLDRRGARAIESVHGVGPGIFEGRGRDPQPALGVEGERCHVGEPGRSRRRWPPRKPTASRPHRPTWCNP